MSKVLLLGPADKLYKLVKEYLQQQHFTVVDTVDGPVTAVIDLNTYWFHKKDQLSKAEAKLPIDTPFFSSAIGHTATEVASWLQYPQRVVGFSPWLLDEMPLLEVSAPLQVEDKMAWEKHLQFWTKLGKKVIEVGDVPGLVFPRTLALIVNEAALAASEGVASKEEIDLAMKLGTGYPYGPFAWAERIGMGQIMAVIDGLGELRSDMYRPAYMLRQLAHSQRSPSPQVPV